MSRRRESSRYNGMAAMKKNVTVMAAKKNRMRGGIGPPFTCVCGRQTAASAPILFEPQGQQNGRERHGKSTKETQVEQHLRQVASQVDAEADDDQLHQVVVDADQDEATNLATIDSVIGSRHRSPAQHLLNASLREP